MKKIIFMVLAFVAAGIAFANDCVDSSKTEFIFADKAKGSELLKTEDDFTNNLSEFDISARLKTSKKVTKQEYLDFIGKQAMDWTEEEKLYLNTALGEIIPLFKKYKIMLPKEIYLVKTTGEEEGDSAYCRHNNVIVFSKNMINMADLNAMEELMIHEIFHIFSKNNLDVREKLYNSIGFYKTNELEFESTMAQYKITNPDSVSNSYYFNSTINGKKEKVMPILFAAGDYDEAKGGEFFDYMMLAFCALEENGDNTKVKKVNDNYALYTFNQIPNYLSLVGENTGYIIHAEEILADNFVLLVTNSKNVKTKKVITNMKKILKK